MGKIPENECLVKRGRVWSAVGGNKKRGQSLTMRLHTRETHTVVMETSNINSGRKKRLSGALVPALLGGEIIRGFS